ncbi:AICARFT/IMPCHase bienzyme [Rhizoctonia solani]|uniref:AICARFT/IMPCHase bienzyme n=1 Tax=Rhizoctonia solani TaxID=456999 RepID=A0A8H7M6J8_9AGAM|nr:AICARFT/IMPCHase bienzyme [Rhizoctonia solani]
MPLRYGANPHQKPARHSLRVETPFQGVGWITYINLLDALNAYALVSELQEALQLPAAASFKHVSPAGAAVGLELNDVEKMCRSYVFIRRLYRVISPLRSRDCQNHFREVSDGVIAPGYSEEALEIDPTYNPGKLETRQVFGVSLQQNRNDAKITAELFSNIVSANKDLPREAVVDLIVATLALKYTQSNSVAYALRGPSLVLVQVNNHAYIALVLQSGVKYLAAPGGSVMDAECIKAADEHGIVFAHTSLRLFHH